MSELPEIYTRLNSLKQTLEAQQEEVAEQRTFVDDIAAQLDKERFNLNLMESTANLTYQQMQATHQQLQGFSAYEASKLLPVGDLAEQLANARREQQRGANPAAAMEPTPVRPTDKPTLDRTQTPQPPADDVVVGD